LNTCYWWRSFWSAMNIAHTRPQEQPKSFFSTGIQKLVERYNKCIVLQGDCIEKWYVKLLTVTSIKAVKYILPLLFDSPSYMLFFLPHYFLCHTHTEDGVCFMFEYIWFCNMYYSWEWSLAWNLVMPVAEAYMVNCLSLSWSTTLFPFVESVASLLFAQKSTTVCCSEPEEFSTHFHTWVLHYLGDIFRNLQI